MNTLGICRIFILFSVSLACACALSSLAQAGGHTVIAGPVITGTGGSNPISFTSPLEFGYIYTNSPKDREYVISLVPGIGYGARFNMSPNLHASVGGMLGLVYMGPYMAAGYNFWCPWKTCFSFDYQASLSVLPLVKYYSKVALGFTLWTN